MMSEGDDITFVLLVVKKTHGVILVSALCSLGGFRGSWFGVTNVSLLL